MTERGGELRLPEKALAELLVGCQLRRDQLERHRAVERGIGGPVDDAHAAPADLFLDAVARELGARRESSSGHHPSIRSVAATESPRVPTLGMHRHPDDTVADDDVTRAQQR